MSAVMTGGPRREGDAEFLRSLQQAMAGFFERLGEAGSLPRESMFLSAEAMVTLVRRFGDELVAASRHERLEETLAQWKERNGPAAAELVRVGRNFPPNYPFPPSYLQLFTSESVERFIEFHLRDKFPDAP